MTADLIMSLRREESALLEELRVLPKFRRYEVVRQLLDLYSGPVPVGAELDRLLEGPQPARATKADRYAAASLDILASIGSEMRADIA